MKINDQLQFMTLDYAKEHLRLDGDVEDNELLMLIASVEQEALDYMERTAEDIEAEYGGIPMPIVNAILVRVATRYENRGEITQKTNNQIAPNSWEAMLMRYVREEAV